VSPEEERSKRALLKGKVDEETGLIHVGQDVAGIVKAVGSDVCSLKAGDRVVGALKTTYFIMKFMN
jgi:Zn-dependent alcohol dehydrogenase